MGRLRNNLLGLKLYAVPRTTTESGEALLQPARTQSLLRLLVCPCCGRYLPISHSIAASGVRLISVGAQCVRWSSVCSPEAESQGLRCPPPSSTTSAPRPLIIIRRWRVSALSKMLGGRNRARTSSITPHCLNSSL